jgi:hypothetical protein
VVAEAELHSGGKEGMELVAMSCTEATKNGRRNPEAKRSVLNC